MEHRQWLLAPKYPLITKLLNAYLVHIQVEGVDPESILAEIDEDFGDENGFDAAEAYLATLGEEQFVKLASSEAGKEYEAFSKSIPDEHHGARSALADLFETADNFK